MAGENKEDLIKSFDEALEALNSQIGGEAGGQGELGKSTSDATATNSEKQPKAEKKKDEEDEEDEEEDDEEEVGKSMEDEISQDEEAEAAMDVEPFLRGLVKSFDEKINELSKSVNKKFGEVEDLQKSMAQLVSKQAELQKSLYDEVDKIGQQPVPSSSVTRMAKSRFGEGEEAQEVDGPTVLRKSQQWLQDGSIDLTEASMIESRVNHGSLGKSGDSLDNKVQQMLKS